MLKLRREYPFLHDNGCTVIVIAVSVLLPLVSNCTGAFSAWRG